MIYIDGEWKRLIPHHDYLDYWVADLLDLAEVLIPIPEHNGDTDRFCTLRKWFKDIQSSGIMNEKELCQVKIAMRIH
jgi:hypothetical protein